MASGISGIGKTSMLEKNLESSSKIKNTWRYNKWYIEDYKRIDLLIEKKPSQT